MRHFNKPSKLSDDLDRSSHAYGKPPVITVDSSVPAYDGARHVLNIWKDACLTVDRLSTSARNDWPGAIVAMHHHKDGVRLQFRTPLHELRFKGVIVGAWEKANGIRPKVEIVPYSFENGVTGARDPQSVSLNGTDSRRSLAHINSRITRQKTAIASSRRLSPRSKSDMTMPPNQITDNDRYLRLPEVLALTGVSWRTLLRWERSGHFPKRYKIGPRIVAWKESEVLQWFAERATAATSKGWSL